ncbi:F-box/LRR-repeat protein 3-like [Vicia villosa]|uniref:F-box/LRR-repeat protein 3-like n=1 Tax=Vicia villosa TaxID=3911 RepID=UPI00273C3744|nr:F-box/LRR-repeat protein 3-like [Vicia villosa]
MSGFDPEVACHHLTIDPTCKAIAQRRRKQSPEKTAAAELAVKDLLEASIFHRFSNLNSLDLWFDSHDLDAIIASALRDRPTLKSLSLSRIKQEDANYVDSLVSLKGLNCLQLRFSKISDDLLYSIAREVIPLKRFVLEYCIGYSYDGVYGLLSKCHGIQHLHIQGNHFLNNLHVAQLSLLLPGLVSITLSQCSKLTELALFALIRNCPSLGEITMEHTYMRRESEENSYSLKDFHVNLQLKFLHLAHNLLIDEESIILFANIFPNLQHLDLSYCNRVSKKSICQVLSKCCKIRHLNLAYCNEVKRLKMNILVYHLEVLNLSGTSVRDKTIYEISKSYRGILQLLLTRCHYITEKGVISVVENCTQLKEINLRDCKKVDPCVVVLKIFVSYLLPPSLAAWVNVVASGWN